jgi:hypothetical protein
VHERGGLERVRVRLAREPVRRQPAQLGIDQRQQFRRRARVTGRGGLQDVGHVGHGRNDAIGTGATKGRFSGGAAQASRGTIDAISSN